MSDGAQSPTADLIRDGRTGELLTPEEIAETARRVADADIADDLARRAASATEG